MRKAIALILCMAMSATFMFTLMNANAQAEKPDWEKGDEWSMGSKIDFQETLGPQIELLTGLASMSEDIESLDIDLDGDLSNFEIFEITDVTDTEYKMSIRSGTYLNLDASLSMEMEMPEEGTYTFDTWDYEPPTEMKEISADILADISLGMTGTAIFAKEDLSIQEMDLEVTLEGEVDFRILNFPEEEYEWNSETDEEILTVSYTSYDISGSADVELTLDMDFDSGLDIFDFPIEDGETWDVESMMTVSGTYEGTIDGEGIPSELMTELGLVGLSLPLVLEDIVTGEDDIHDGILEPQTVPVSFALECTGMDKVTLEDGSSTDVYVIEMASMYDDSYDDYEDDFSFEDESYEEPYYEEESTIGLLFGLGYVEYVKFLYSDDEGFFVSAAMSGMEELDLIMGSSSDELLMMQPVSHDDAEKNLESIDKGGVGGSYDDDDFSPLLLILVGGMLLMMIIFLLIIVILISVLRKKKE